MKFSDLGLTYDETTGRSPCGGRGLKCDSRFVLLLTVESLPLRGAWVEMLKIPH